MWSYLSWNMTASSSFVWLYTWMLTALISICVILRLKCICLLRISYKRLLLAISDYMFESICHQNTLWGIPVGLRSIQTIVLRLWIHLESCWLQLRCLIYTVATVPIANRPWLQLGVRDNLSRYLCFLTGLSLAVHKAFKSIGSTSLTCWHHYLVFDITSIGIILYNNLITLSILH